MRNGMLPTAKNRTTAYMFAVMIASMLTIGGCSTFDGLLQTIGLGASTKIEAFLAAQVAGEYEVVISKDGEALLTERWECTKDAETGKLTGCHKR